MSRYRTGLKHPKTDAIVLAYLQGKCHNDHFEAGMANKSEHTRNSTLYVENIVKTSIAQDRTLVWC